MQEPAQSPLLGPVAIRELADVLGVQPTKKLGQNFLHDAGTVRRIVATAGVQAGETIVEVGPGLGSLTLGLLEAGAQVCAVEIDPPLAHALPQTVQARFPEGAGRLRVHRGDALGVASWSEIADGWPQPTRLVANLPYNVAVPILLHFLAIMPSLESALVMVQSEVADRLVAGPGSRTYGVPSVKAAWYGVANRAGAIGRSVFWPAPNVDSALVDLQVSPRPRGGRELRNATFKTIDVAFSQRRKMLRSALRGWVDSAAEVATWLERADVDGSRRGESLTIEHFVALGQVALVATDSDLPLLAGAVAELGQGKRYD